MVPRVSHLCSKLGPAATDDTVSPVPTEFRWLGLMLGATIKGGTIARRRNLIHRIVKGDLGLGAHDRPEEMHGSRLDGAKLSHMEESWVIQVLLPALDVVGWDR